MRYLWKHRETLITGLVTRKLFYIMSVRNLQKQSNMFSETSQRYMYLFGPKHTLFGRRGGTPLPITKISLFVFVHKRSTSLQGKLLEMAWLRGSHFSQSLRLSVWRSPGTFRVTINPAFPIGIPCCIVAGFIVFFSAQLSKITRWHHQDCCGQSTWMTSVSNVASTRYTLSASIIGRRWMATLYRSGGGE